MEGTMTSLIDTITNSAAQIIQAPFIVGATLIAASVKSNAQDKSKAKDARLDERTKADIGLEKGSITWVE